MKTVFKAFISSKRIYEFKIPETFFERLRGLKLFSYIHPECGLAFRAPCALHTFGLQSEIWILELDKQFEPVSFPRRCPPNSIVFSGNGAHWLAELYACPQESISLPDKAKTSSIPVIWTPASSLLNLFKTTIRIFILANLALFFTTLALASQKPINLPVGESKEVRLEEAPRSLDISQPDVIDVQRIGTSNKILITALRSGSSRLSAHFSQGQKKEWYFQVGVSGQIADTHPSLSSASLLRMARDIQRRAGLDAVLDNGRIAIFGQLQNEMQMNVLAELCLGREECLPRYSATPEAIRLQAKYLNRFFMENGFTGISVEASIGGVAVKGSTDGNDSLEKINHYLRTFLSRYNINVIPDKTGQALIESQLTFFKLNMNQLHAIGIAFEKKGNDASQELIKANIPSFIAQIKAGPRINMAFPDVILNALAKKGIIQQIARPTVVTASGGKSDIQTGGELLFRSTGQNQKFYSQNYGLIASIQPRYNGNGRISQKIEIKLANPQTNPNPSALSGMDQNILNTEVSMKPDEHILLTRINQKVSGKSVLKIPILGHIPIIGEIFKSREIQSEDSELWITLRSRLEVSAPPEIQLPDANLIEEKPQAHWMD